MNSVTIKYLLAFSIALILIAFVHSYFITIYTDNSKEYFNKHLVVKTNNPPQGRLCLYQHQSNYYIGRAVAVAGDTVIIRNSLAIVNGLPQDSGTSYRAYRKLVFNKSGKHTVGDTILSAKYSQDFKTKVHWYKALSYPNHTNHKVFFPHSFRFRWNADFMGPIIVPSKQMTLPASKKNRTLYRNISKEKDGSLTFDINYFFILNDNRANTADSRTFGFISSEAVIGYISYSFEYSKRNTKSR